MIKTILAAVRGERQETEASPPRGQTVHGWPVGNSNLECHLLTLRWKEVFLQRAALERRLTENRRELWALQTFLF